MTVGAWTDSLSSVVGLLTSRLSDFDEDRVELVAEVGSSAYGLSVDAASDRDFTAVWLPTFRQLVSGVPEYKQARTQPDGVRSGPGDLDVNLYSLPKFTRLVCKGNPSILAALYAPSTIRHVPLVDALRTAGRTVAALNAFLGYANQQAKNLGIRGGRGRVSRPELIERYGYDVKFAAHALRLTLQGIHYARHGTIPAPMPDHDRVTVLAVRRGVWPLARVDSYLTEQVATLERERDSSPWPDRTDPAVWDAVADVLWLNADWA